MTLSTSSKKTVRYSQLGACMVGSSALLLPVDHPGPHVSNTKFVTTSTVLSFDPETGIIETLNTRYVPVGAA